MKKYAEYQQTLKHFVTGYRTHADAAADLGVHPSAVSQALKDVEEGKREVFVKGRKVRGVFPAISVKTFGKVAQTTNGL